MDYNHTPEFWETAFQEKQEMWGMEPARCAVIAAELFEEAHAARILIPGIGYGRNAKVFIDRGMQVTGIEISATAIALARQHFAEELIIHHGSVTDMPFDDQTYDGIFCHALIHLLDRDARKKLIDDCYRQLNNNGLMLFSVIAKSSPTFGQGKVIGTDRYEQFGGVQLFFYDEASIHAEFHHAGLLQITPVTENFPFYLIVCKKICLPTSLP